MVGSGIVRSPQQRSQTVIVARSHASQHMGDGEQQLVGVIFS